LGVAALGVADLSAVSSNASLAQLPPLDDRRLSRTLVVSPLGAALKSRAGVLDAATSAAHASAATASSSALRPLAGVAAFGVAALGVAALGDAADAAEERRDLPELLGAGSSSSSSSSSVSTRASAGSERRAFFSDLGAVSPKASLAQSAPAEDRRLSRPLVVRPLGADLKSRLGVLDAATSAAHASAATASSSAFRPLAGVRALGVAALGDAADAPDERRDLPEPLGAGAASSTSISSSASLPSSLSSSSLSVSSSPGAAASDLRALRTDLGATSAYASSAHLAPLDERRLLRGSATPLSAAL